MISYNVPDCTLTTCCLYVETGRSVQELIKSSLCLLRLPIYLVIYCDILTYPHLYKHRKDNGLLEITIFKQIQLEDMWSYQFKDQVIKNRLAYYPTKDGRTNEVTHLITINKFDFVLETIHTNVFNTSKFGWIDCLLGSDKMRICRNYKENTLPYILRNVDDYFRIMVINVNDKKYISKENKKEFYKRYRWVVAGGFFTCGADTGIPILNNLKQNAETTINLGYGHGEEMLFLEILEANNKMIKRSYGDYDVILNNFLGSCEKLEYIYYNIIQNYLYLGYFEEGLHCINNVLENIHQCKAYVEPIIHVQILIDYFIATYYINREHTNCYAAMNKVFYICQHNPLLKIELKKHIYRLNEYIECLNITIPEYLK